MELFQKLQLTRLGRLFWAWLTLSALSAVLCWLLFGWPKVFLLVAACGLSFCAFSFLCYSTEARRWREQVDQWYEELFVLALNYEHKSRLPLATPKSEVGPSTLDSRSAQTDEKPQPSKMCHKEAQKMIQLIMKHFVHEWYSGITSDVEFPDDVQKILEHVALELNVRLKKIDLEEIVCEVTTLVLPYLQAVNDTGERDFNGIKVFDVTHEKCLRDFESNPEVEHRALRSREQELRYYRQALDALIQCAVPKEYGTCDAACTFVREILLANIIEPLLDLLCDPDFLYESIPMVLSKASKEKVDREMADIQRENEVLEKQLSRGRLIVKMQEQQRVRFHSFSSNRFGHSFNEGSPSRMYDPGRFPHSKVSPLPRPMSMANFPSPSAAGRRDSPYSWYIGEFGLREQVHEDVGISESQDDATDYVLPKLSPREQQSSSHHRSVSEAASLPPDYAVKGFDVREDHYADVGSEEVPSQTDLVMIELAPIYIDRHVRVISGGTSSYIAYVFKFPKRMLSDEELSELSVWESDTHLEAMKRYSEFRTLHTKLLKSSDYARHIKGLELPEKGGVLRIVSKMPFASAEHDPAFLLDRRNGLEKYLQSISSVSEIAESECFHTFLKSGVKSLKEAHVVSNPQKAKRRSFLGIVKAPVTEDVQKAEPIPKRSIEAMLSGYLNTHLPLPCCSFHSVHTIRTKRYKRSVQQTDSPRTSHSPLKARSSVLGDSNFNVASTSPSQSLGSSHSISSSTETSLVAANHSEGAETAAVRPNSLGEDTSLTTCTTTATTTPDFNSCDYDKLAHDTCSNSIGGSGKDTSKLSAVLTSDDCRTGSSSLSDMKPEVTVRLRQSAAREAQATDNSPRIGHFAGDNRSKPSLKTRLERLISKLIMFLTRLVSLVAHVVQRGLDPITRHSTLAVVKEQQERVPLTNAFFSLGTEVSRKHCPELWACNEHTQLSLLVVAGGVCERYIWKELKEVVYAEENWARALYHLRHTLWPHGKVMKSSRHKLNERERDELKQRAADAIKKFLPDFLPYIVGSEDYNAAAIHCLNCLANPRLNRHFVLRIIEVFLMRLIPEIQESTFKAHLERLRTLKSAHSTSRPSVSNTSTFLRRTLQKSDTM